MNGANKFLVSFTMPLDMLKRGFKIKLVENGEANALCSIAKSLKILVEKGLPK